ncbi:hypothetical protein MKK65_19915 [Methylobacterium sp. J-001]|uniref:hypothetical protein n=1 Tax=Methylobacterium sp. J-001 TaxID=2836609 RepID=UPI001FBBA194|nr:hypothetical protein [Methylobacterium sp. J-001]MCJ2118804.1 hypothetical protein [Methylobacterium sp. J-001]
MSDCFAAWALQNCRYSAALRTTRLITTTLYGGATNGEYFRAYVAGSQAPVLRAGRRAILDKQQSRKNVGLFEIIEVAEARFPYLSG